MTPDFDPYHKWLGIPPHEQPANHYRLLGISLFEADPDVIEHAADRQMSHLRTHTSGPHSGVSQTLLNEIASAKLCLLNAVKRADYDVQLRASMAPAAPAYPQPIAAPVPLSTAYVPAPYDQQGNYAAPAYPLPGAQTPAYPGQGYATPAYVSVPAPVPVTYQQTDEQPGVFAEEAGPLVNARRGRSRRAATPLWIKVVGQVVASVVGLSAGYAILCWMGPQNDFLGLMSSPPNAVSQGSGDTSGKTTAGNGQGTSTPNNGDRVGGKYAALDLLPLIDTQRDAVLGDWRLENGVLLSPANQTQARLNLPVPGSTPDEYELTVVVVRQANSGPSRALIAGLVLGGEERQVLIDQEGKFAGLDSVDHKSYRENRTTSEKPQFTDGTPARVKYIVTKGDVRVEVDGREIIHWSGELSELGIQRTTPDASQPPRLFLGSGATYRFTQITFKRLKAKSTSAVASNSPPKRETFPSQQPAPPRETRPKPVPPKTTPPKTTPPKTASKPKPPRTLGDLLNASPKKPVPETADFKAAERRLRDEYKDDFAKAKSDAGEKSRLAQKLLDRVRGTVGKPAEVYAGLELAIELAGEAADGKVAGEALDELGQQFRVDLLARRDEVMKDAIKRAKTPDDWKTAANAYRQLLNGAISEDRYDLAVKFGGKSLEYARKSKDNVLVKVLVDGVKELKSLQAAFDDVKDAKETLESSTEDAEACRRWGRFLCLYKNDWENGRTLWCQSTDNDPLARLAADDLDGPQQSQRAVLADGWWNAAEEEADPLPQRMLRERAVHWYRLALPSLTGTRKTLVEKRLQEFDQARSLFPIDKWVDVLQMVDLNRHKVDGGWVRNGDAIGITRAGRTSRFEIPVALAGSYDLEVAFTLLKGYDAIFTLPVGTSHCNLIINGWKGTTSGLARVGNKGGDQNSTTLKHSRLSLNSRQRLQIHVESNGNAKVDVTLNDKDWVHYEGPQSALSLDNAWKLLHTGTAGLGTYEADIIYHSARIRLNSGSASLITD